MGTSPLKKEVKEEDLVCESEESGSDMEVDDVAYFALYVSFDWLAWRASC